MPAALLSRPRLPVRAALRLAPLGDIWHKPALSGVVALAVPLLALLWTGRLDLVLYVAAGSMCALYGHTLPYAARAKTLTWVILGMLTSTATALTTSALTGRAADSLTGSVTGSVTGSLTESFTESVTSWVAGSVTGAVVVRVAVVALLAGLHKAFCDATGIGPPGNVVLTFVAASAAFVPQRLADVPVHVGLGLLGGVVAWLVGMTPALFRPDGPERIAVARALESSAHQLRTPDPTRPDRQATRPDHHATATFDAAPDGLDPHASGAHPERHADATSDARHKRHDVAHDAPNHPDGPHGPDAFGAHPGRRADATSDARPERHDVALDVPDGRLGAGGASGADGADGPHASGACYGGHAVAASVDAAWDTLARSGSRSVAGLARLLIHAESAACAEDDRGGGRERAAAELARWARDLREGRPLPTPPPGADERSASRPVPGTAERSASRSASWLDERSASRSVSWPAERSRSRTVSWRGMRSPSQPVSGSGERRPVDLGIGRVLLEVGRGWRGVVAVFGGCAVAGWGSMVLGVGRPYWAVVTAAAVIAADTTMSWSRALQRVVGNLVGVGLFALIAPVTRLGVVALVVGVLALQFVTEAAITRNYWLGSVFVTPMAILMTEFAGAQPVAVLVGDRWLDTCLGAVAGLLACVLVPGRRAAPAEARGRPGLAAT